MNPWRGGRKMTVVTACAFAGGEPGFAITDVRVTHDEYENGVHYDLVADRLLDDRYEKPFVHFDEFDMPRFLLPAVRKYLGLPAKKPAAKPKPSRRKS